MFNIFFKGFVTGLVLIIPIGPQNAFVLRQGILKNHLFVTALICSLFDCILFSVGIGGVGKAIGTSPVFFEIVRWIGVLFLSYLAIQSLRRVFKSSNETIDLEGVYRPNLKTTILTVFGLTLLNPHVYIDAFVLIGSLGASYGEARFQFATGVICASFFWFFSLSIGASKISPIFKNPKAWIVLDLLIGFIMFWIVYTLVTIDCPHVKS